MSVIARSGWSSPIVAESQGYSVLRRTRQSGKPIVEAGAWPKLLLAFDIVFVAACTLAYPFTVED
jgi:hypothetical protein